MQLGRGFHGDFGWKPILFIAVVFFVMLAPDALEQRRELDALRARSEERRAHGLRPGEALPEAAPHEPARPARIIGQPDDPSVDPLIVAGAAGGGVLILGAFGAWLLFGGRDSEGPVGEAPPTPPAPDDGESWVSYDDDGAR